MAYINKARSFNSRPSLGSTFTSKASPNGVAKDLGSLPFDSLYRAYTKAANEWEVLAIADARDDYNRYIQACIKAKESQYTESYEGNLTDETTSSFTGLDATKRIKGRRKAGQTAAIEFVKYLNLGDQWSNHILPQIITLVGNMPIVKDEQGLISGKAFTSNFSTDWERGLYLFLMLDTRSSYLSTQYKGVSKPYSSLVPLILYAVRLVKGVPYTAWGRDELSYVVNVGLCEAMLFTTDQWPSTEEIMAGRDQGLTVSTGKTAGTVRSPVSTYKLYATANTCFQGMPRDAQVMLAQIWVAHPDNRTKYMVLDPKDWDNMPPPLVSTEVLEDFTGNRYSLPESLGSADLPWEY